LGAQNIEFYDLPSLATLAKNDLPHNLKLELILEICKSQGWKIRNYLE